MLVEMLLQGGWLEGVRRGKGICYLLYKIIKC